MCGICGFNWKDEELIKRMNDKIVHRGPDQDGIYCDDEVSLGHRRLSIIDLSEHGRQPMYNEDKSVCLVFNGEIYNFCELREILLEKGHTFSSNSDSEVIIHAYEEYGTGVFEKLRGMFAFALYDMKEKNLLLPFIQRFFSGQLIRFYTISASQTYLLFWQSTVQVSLEMMVRFFLPEASRAAISRWGRPARRKPPIMMEAPSGMPATASSGVMGVFMAVSLFRFGAARARTSQGVGSTGGGAAKGRMRLFGALAQRRFDLRHGLEQVTTNQPFG